MNFETDFNGALLGCYHLAVPVGTTAFLMFYAIGRVKLFIGNKCGRKRQNRLSTTSSENEDPTSIEKLVIN